MTYLLNWREAVRQDRQELAAFTCTRAPVRSTIYPSKWEYERPHEAKVQGWIRNDLKPPLVHPLHLLVGSDDVGIGAVSWLEEETVTGDFFLKLMAIHCRLRDKGGGYADEMVEETLDFITTAAISAGRDLVRVTGRVSEHNHNSQDMCRRAGLRHTGLVEGGRSLQVWSIDLIFADAPGIL